MTWFNSIPGRIAAVGVLSAALGFLAAWPVFATGQDKKDPAPDPAAKLAPPAGGPTETNKELADQIRQLNAKVARLEAALKQDLIATPSGAPAKGGPADQPVKVDGVPPGKRIAAKYQNCAECHKTRPTGPLPPNHLEPAEGSDKGANQDDQTGTAANKTPADGKAGMAGMSDKGMGMKGMGMGMMKGKGMGMEGKGKGMAGGGGGMGGMKDDAMGGGGGGMGMMDDDMGMMGMMGMGSMGGPKGQKMKMVAALPGFPGASHIYHIGATDFFLNHPEHITLSTEQTTKLGQMKQKAVTEKASAQRKIDEAEQQLWELTAADQPDAAKIDAKVREAEKLRGDQRLAFIRSVGEAAKVLTDGQRQVLMGDAKPDAHKDLQPPAKPAGSPPPGVAKIAPPEPGKAPAKPVPPDDIL
jgi:Spy/CpxP family protein refolding chaperone